MEKKYYIFSIFLLLLLIISIVSTSGNTSITEVVNRNENRNKPVTLPPVDDLFNDNNDNIDHENEDDSIYSNLVFGENIEIIDIKQMGEDYIAIGSKDQKPYLEVLKLVDNKLVNNNLYTNYNILTGKITDLLRKDYFLSSVIKNDLNQTVYQDFFVSRNNIIPFYKKQININYSKYATLNPKYLVIHETNNTKAGADASAHYRYWSTNPDAQASTHFVVDSTQIYQMLELDQVAWHVGDNKGHSDITNFNSIGIEIAVNSDGDYEEARLNAIELTIQLMKELNMDISQLKRHYDASGKLCPLTMIEDPSLWDDFVNQVRIGLEN